MRKNFGEFAAEQEEAADSGSSSVSFDLSIYKSLKSVNKKTEENILF